MQCPVVFNTSINYCKPKSLKEAPPSLMTTKFSHNEE